MQSLIQPGAAPRQVERDFRPLAVRFVAKRCAWLLGVRRLVDWLFDLVQDGEPEVFVENWYLADGKLVERRSDWIPLDSVSFQRLELRAATPGEIAAGGLAGLTPGGAVPQPMPWTEIAPATAAGAKLFGSRN